MAFLIPSAFRRALAALGIVVLALAGAGRAGAAAAGATPTRVRFQLGSECDCASCGFALQSELRKVPGISRVELSPREHLVAVTFDESRVPLSRVAASVAHTELGKHSALIGDLTGSTTGPTAPALNQVPGVRAATVDAKKGRLLVELVDEAPVTSAALAADLAKAGMAVRFDSAAQRTAAHR